MTLQTGKLVGEHVYVAGHERVYVVWGTHKKHIICVAPYAMMDGPDPDDPDACLDKVKLRDVLTKQKRSRDRGLYSNGMPNLIEHPEVVIYLAVFLGAASLVNLVVALVRPKRPQEGTE